MDNLTFQGYNLMDDLTFQDNNLMDDLTFRDKNLKGELKFKDNNLMDSLIEFYVVESKQFEHEVSKLWMLKQICIILSMVHISLYYFSYLDLIIHRKWCFVYLFHSCICEINNILLFHLHILCCVCSWSHCKVRLRDWKMRNQMKLRPYGKRLQKLTMSGSTLKTWYDEF